jgi:hypothetical protein
MPFRENDPDFESELFEKVRAALNAKFGVFEYNLPLRFSSSMNMRRSHCRAMNLPRSSPSAPNVGAHPCAFYEQVDAAYNEIKDPHQARNPAVEL